MYRNLILGLGVAGNMFFYGGLNLAEVKGIEYLVTSKQQAKQVAYTSAKAATLGFFLAGAAALQLRHHDSLERKIE